MTHNAKGRAPKVLVLDVGMGNLRSVARALERAGAVASISGDPEDVARADRLVFPGQGHFGDCARALERGGLGDALRSFVASERPFLGICLGMQILFEQSEEAPGLSGLGVIAGRVKRFPAGLKREDGSRLKVPHMGWSEVRGEHPWIGDAAKDRWLYFVHSYYCEPAVEARDRVALMATHGVEFCAAVAWGNVLATQFHPEKSQHAGHALLTRFLGDGPCS